MHADLHQPASPRHDPGARAGAFLNVVGSVILDGFSGDEARPFVAEVR